MVVTTYPVQRAVFKSLTLILCLAAGGCTGNATAALPSTLPQQHLKPKILRVGVAESAPPLIFKQGDQIVGIEADMARELAGELGRELEFVSIWWPNLTFELRKRHIDIIMAGMSLTPERAREVAFAQPYLHIGQMAMIRSVDRSRMATADTIRMRGKSVGVEENTTGEIYARTHLLLTEVRTYPTLDAAAGALLQGKIDAVIHDSPSIQWLVHQHHDGALVAVPGLLTDEHLAWAVRRDNTALLEAVNGVLARWKATGHLDEIIHRWLTDE